MYHNRHNNNRTFYEYFIDMFCSLFQLNNNLAINPIQIHNDILHENGSIVSNNLIRISIFTRVDLKMKLIESVREIFTKYDKLQDIYIDCVAYILDNIQNGNIPNTLIPQPIYMVHENVVDENNPNEKNCSDLFVKSFFNWYHRVIINDINMIIIFLIYLNMNLIIQNIKYYHLYHMRLPI